MASKNNHGIIDYTTLKTAADIEAEMKHELMCAEMNDIVGGFLCKTYRGYPWAVHANIKQGIVNFWIGGLDLSGRAPLGATVKIETSLQPMLMDVKRYAGELLERYGLNRGKMNADQFEQLRETADFAGRVKVDES